MKEVERKNIGGRKGIKKPFERLKKL